HGPLASAWRVLVIDEFALPAPVGTGVSADIVEEAVTSAHQTIAQQHDAGVATVDAVEHSDVNGIKTVADTTRSRRHDRRRGLLTNRRHNPTERHSWQLHRIAFEVILIALRPAPEFQVDPVALEQGLEIRVFVVAHR